MAGGAGTIVEADQQNARGALNPWTIPILISFLRLIGVPTFLYLYLATDHHGWAVAILTAGGLSDWVDGFAARRLNQVSRLGELLDPAADRLYILATIVAFTAKCLLPLAFTVALLAREAVLGVCLLILRRYGYGPPPVHYVGKTATFILLFAFPILLLARVIGGGRQPESTAEMLTHSSGWALAWWGLVLYWVAAAFYVEQITTLVREARRTGAET